MHDSDLSFLRRFPKFKNTERRSVGPRAANFVLPSPQLDGERLKEELRASFKFKFRFFYPLGRPSHDRRCTNEVHQGF